MAGRVISQASPVTYKFRLEYLGGVAPVQGLGKINGFAWYFWARGDSWRFAVADFVEKEAADAISVAAEYARGFVLSKGFGREEGGWASSEMSYDTALRIIRRCCRTFVAFSAN